ncbi:hypothetical protein K466DRAFT_605703 [Polyporus arcularius HHB13444]|uniref:Uncharacterized protein n=1 Tax=Polyporus arcularius HHB13444 TaxID=1314778 RepID=A0A5C3NSL2_9APHY|nr:hypothetical protein K466DRAFT_605703 [Polyporus arcularius HHB13444]
MFGGISPSYAASCGMSMIADAKGLAMTQPLVSFAHRMPVVVNAPVPDIDVGELMDAVDPTEESSLIPTGHKRGGNRDIFYTLCLKLRPSDVTHRSIRLRVVKKEFHLAVDTADSSFWFMQEGFQELHEGGDGVYITRDWPEDFAQTRLRRRCLPRPDEPSMGGCVRWGYMDGGAVGKYNALVTVQILRNTDAVVELERWPVSQDLTFALPAWDWTNNCRAKSTVLRIPQVLARALSVEAATQPVDGNAGFAVPGWRAPWGNVDEADRVTIFDVLHEADCVEAVEDIAGGELTEMQLAIRLLIPTGEQLADNDRTRSFLYFGRGTPCGVSLNDGTLALPEFSPPMLIFPDIRVPTEFHMWTLELVAITLLEPIVDNPNYADTAINEWSARRINMAEPRIDETDPIIELEDGTLELNIREGIRTNFDSCSGCSTLPIQVVKKIWTEWYGQPIATFPLPGPDGHTAIWHFGSSERFKDRDLEFEFLDRARKRHRIRCGAQAFLSSPWSYYGDDNLLRTCSCIREDGEETMARANNVWTLGMNFFWSFIVKLEATYTHPRPKPENWRHNPTIRFAPQRIVKDGVRIANTWDLEIHGNLPPRLQNELRGGGVPQLHPGDGDE